MRVLHSWYLYIWRHYRCQSEGATQLVLIYMEIFVACKSGGTTHEVGTVEQVIISTYQPVTCSGKCRHRLVT